jgi:hypothetical protein
MVRSMTFLLASLVFGILCIGLVFEVACIVRSCSAIPPIYVISHYLPCGWVAEPSFRPRRIVTVFIGFEPRHASCMQAIYRSCVIRSHCHVGMTSCECSGIQVSPNDCWLIRVLIVSLSNFGVHVCLLRWLRACEMFHSYSVASEYLLSI